MKTSSTAYILFFMLAVSVVFGVGISSVHQATLDTLARNETLHKNRVLCRAFALDVKEVTPEAYREAVDRFINHETLDFAGRVFEVFTTRSPATDQLGFLFVGQGFWGPIKGIVVLSPDIETMRNIQILEHQETPGLGARIEEPWFLDQFKGLRIAWNRPPDERVVIGGTADSAMTNRVDAITGASQTSMALMRSLNEELDAFRKAYQAK